MTIADFQQKLLTPDGPMRFVANVWHSGPKLTGVIVSLMLGLAFSATVNGQDTHFTNSIGMEFMRVEAGALRIGQFYPPYPVPEDTVSGIRRPMVMWMGEGRPYGTEEFRLARELALQDTSAGFIVHIYRPFYIGKFEVTQEEWLRVMEENPSTFQGMRMENSGRHPVENVTWDMAQEFLRRLSRLEGKVYRLPTEFEWEHAARAGQEGDIAWDATQRVAQLGGSSTKPVGQKEANALGLYDMLGNVWEWVEDYYNEKIFADPMPPSTGQTHVLKGASFAGDVKNATWLTHAGGPGNGWDVGFRVVLQIPDKEL